MMTRRFEALAGAMLALALLAGAAAAAPGPSPTTGARRVDLNAASAAELEALPGIGPAKAQAIVEHRAREPFKTPDDLRKVKGIGDKLYDSLRDRITVGEAGTASGRGN